MFVYPDNSHPISSVEAESDSFINLYKWFITHMQWPVTYMQWPTCQSSFQLEF